jgi:hypothetical protein
MVEFLPLKFLSQSDMEIQSLENVIIEHDCKVI